MPMVDRILAIDESPDCEDSDDPEAMPCQEIAKREAKKLIVVQTVSVEWKYEDQNEKWNQAGNQL